MFSGPDLHLSEPQGCEKKATVVCDAREITLVLQHRTGSKEQGPSRMELECLVWQAAQSLQQAAGVLQQDCQTTCPLSSIRSMQAVQRW